MDFKREKYGIPAKVAAIEYDPNRTARLALLFYTDGEKRYIIAPLDLKVGDSVMSGPNSRGSHRQLPADFEYSRRHPDPQPGAQRRSGWAAGPFGGWCSPIISQGR